MVQGTLKKRPQSRLRIPCWKDILQKQERKTTKLRFRLGFRLRELVEETGRLERKIHLPDC